MSFDTYSNLKDEIIDASHRGDLDLKIDGFISLAESEMYANAIEPLQLRGEESRASFVTNTTGRFAPLPTGYQSSRKLRIQITNGTSNELYFRTPQQLQINSNVGQPCFFTITDQIEFDRVSDQVYTGEIQYYQEFTPLSSANTTNIVLTNHPTIYLFGAMWALKTYAEEIPEAQNYYQMFINAIRGANNKDNLGRYGPTPVMIPDGPTP